MYIVRLVSQSLYWNRSSIPSTRASYLAIPMGKGLTVHYHDYIHLLSFVFTQTALAKLTPCLNCKLNNEIAKEIV